MKKMFFGANSAAADIGGSSGEGLSLAQLGKGLALACVLMALFSLALAAAYCYTDLSAGTAHLLQLLVLAAAAFAGSFSAAKGAGRKGLWHGLTLAAVILALLLLAGFTGLTAGGISLLAVLVKGLALLLAGCLGGIIGVA